MNELDFRQELLAAFESEYREHLQAMRKVLDTGDVSGAALRDVFRRAHSLKGAARAVELPEVEAIAHELETLLYQSVEQGQALAPDAIHEVGRGLDSIETRMRGPVGPSSDGGDAGRGAPLAISASAAPGLAPGSGRGPGRGSGGGLEAEPAADVGMEPGARLVVAVPGTPPASSDPALRVQAVEIDRLSEAMHALTETMQQQEQTRAGYAWADAELRQLVRLFEGSGLETHAVPGGGELERRLRELSRRMSSSVRTGTVLDWQLDQAAQTLRERLDRVALVVAETVFGPLAAMARDLAREQGGEIEVRLEGMDLLAERGVLQALRDPAIQMLRNAVGHGIGRDVLRAWTDQVASGRPELRQDEPGQDEPGQDEPGEVGGAQSGSLPLSVQPVIRLRVRIRAGRLELAVRDNGAGPDLAAIERTARMRGLLAVGAPVPDEAALLALAFEPGFSTASAVDRLAGRGMGLSIVAEAAARLSGHARMKRLRDAAGRTDGTELLVSVPLAARTQTLLLVEADGHVFGLAGSAVERLLRVPRHAVERPEDKPMARCSDGLLALGALSRLIGGGDSIRLAKPDAMLPVAVLVSGGTRFGLVVERLRDVRALVVRAPDVIGLDRRLVSGIALIEQDQPVLVLETDALVAFLRAGMVGAQPPHPQLPARLGSSGQPLFHEQSATTIAAKTQATILVVDDSITTRTLEKTILQAQGYRVLIAVDGLEALSVLRTAQWAVDVVVADVEMPRLDGFGLLAAMRNDPRLSAIPTVLMTSRNAEADVRRGLELGARAYITKQDFDQGALLATIGQLLP